MEGFFDFFFLIVTFSNLMDSRGRTDGERGDLSEKMFRVFFKEGSEKEGEMTGLGGETELCPALSSGGKSSSENRGGWMISP